MDKIVQVSQIFPGEWDQIINPSPSDLIWAWQMLSNEFNDYVEYRSCGTTYRFIRAGDLDKYLKTAIRVTVTRKR